MKKKLVSAFFAALIIIPLYHCQLDIDIDIENPVPGLTAISPVAMTARMPSFTLTVVGTGFTPASRIVFNNAVKETGYVDSTRLTCQIEPEDIVFPGTGANSGQELGNRNAAIAYVTDQTVRVAVRNPEPGGGDSNSMEFTIKANPGFTVPRSISSPEISASYFNAPSLAITNSGTIYALWDSIPYWYNEPGIYFNTSIDNGDTWSEPRKIRENSSQYVGRTVMAAGNPENIGVVWIDYPELSSPGILFSGSTDSGTNWSVPVTISGAYGSPQTPAIAMDGSGFICAAWEDYDPGLDRPVVVFSYSLDHGISWSTPSALALELPAPKSPAVKVNGTGNVYIACTDSSSRRVYFLRSEDYGGNWAPPVQACQRGSQSPIGLAINNNGHIMISGGSGDAFVVCSSDGGQDWTAPLVISNEIQEVRDPAITVDGTGNFCAVWTLSHLGETDIYFTRSIDNGTAWSTPVNVSNIERGSIMMAGIAAGSQGETGIAWVYLDETLNKWQVVFASGSTDL